jgi:hypothetical protein
VRLRKKKAGASSAICRYTESSVLALRIVRCCPNTSRFHEDEIEIWLQSQNDNMCLFKDSVRYVLKTECNAVIHHVLDSSSNTQLISPDVIKKIINKDFDPMDTYLLLLFEKKELSTFCGGEKT